MKIIFQAIVTQYKIARTDVLNERDKIWQDANKENQKIYERWAKYTDTHKRKNFQLSLKKMKAKQQKNLDLAKKKQKKLVLVDYSLNHIREIKVASLVKSSKLDERIKYDYDSYRRKGYKYSAWLAYRSINNCRR